MQLEPPRQFPSAGQALSGREVAAQDPQNDLGDELFADADFACAIEPELHSLLSEPRHQNSVMQRPGAVLALDYQCDTVLNCPALEKGISVGGGNALHVPLAGLAQLVEHLICSQRVYGSGTLWPSANVLSSCRAKARWLQIAKGFGAAELSPDTI